MSRKGLLSFLLTVITITPLAAAQTSGTWALTGQMANSEQNATATLMQNGKVLVSGGDMGGLAVIINNAQIFDPATNSWKMAHAMRAARMGHGGTLLPNGKVLISGGMNYVSPNLVILKSAELYDPTANTFTATAPMAVPRQAHTATLLPNGKVLVVGGLTYYLVRLGYVVCTATAEIYDPATATWSSAGSMSVPRCGHIAQLLPNGKVLVAGGANYRTYFNSAEIYDPATNTWSRTGSMAITRYGHSAALLQNGKVLVTGPTPTTEIYNPSTGTWSLTASTAAYHSYVPIVTLVSGKVLVAGGNSAGSSELYDPFTSTWVPTGSFNHPARINFPVTLLSDGRVLVSGGAYDWWTGEVYKP
ncbi:MAG TPA: kelch repeat-containing protein [Terriglobales bacterium]|nr:kelch repeat-containing protein [Terriglobales bacterium]